MKAMETTYRGYRFRSNELPTEPKKSISKAADVTGKRFGRAIVVECLGNSKDGYKWWGLVCDCGTKFAARSREINRGHTKSCGCLQRENRRTWGGNAGHNKLAFGRASGNELLSSYVKSAVDRGLEWSLCDAYFFELVSSNCTYCGTPPNKERKPNKGVNGGFLYTGIDRIDSKKGYIVGNVVPCCWDCNRAKGVLSEHEFSSWIDRLIRYSEEKKARAARFEHDERALMARL